MLNANDKNMENRMLQKLLQFRYNITEKIESANIHYSKTYEDIAELLPPKNIIRDEAFIRGNIYAFNSVRDELYIIIDEARTLDSSTCFEHIEHANRTNTPWACTGQPELDSNEWGCTGSKY